jgi:hypothetical protein
MFVPTAGGDVTFPYFLGSQISALPVLRTINGSWERVEQRMLNFMLRFLWVYLEPSNDTQLFFFRRFAGLSAHRDLISRIENVEINISDYAGSKYWMLDLDAGSQLTS